MGGQMKSTLTVWLQV